MYDGEFLVTYPERTFSGTFDLNIIGPVYKGKSRLAWSSTEAVDFKFEAGKKLGEAKDVWLIAQVDTPFVGWSTNSLSSGLYYMNNLLMVNGSVFWAEIQHVGFEVMGDYETKDPKFSCEFKAGINSTIADVPTVGAHFVHLHDNHRMDSNVTVKYLIVNNTVQTFSIKSGWRLDVSSNYRNMSGSIALRSPFDGYKSGALVTKFSLSDNKQLWGAADLDLEEKKFTLTLAGHIKKLTDNMLVMNLTTPIERFRHIVGRFGINDRDKHLVAEIRAPLSALGVEILFKVVSSSEFDVKFNLETPLEAFAKVLAVGKLNPDSVDFRGGWNKVVLGFVGVWRMQNITDFEYSYKVFTPLENFEVNGAVAKFVKKENFDMEMSGQLSKYKIGFKINSKNKSKMVKELKLQKALGLIKSEEDDDDQKKIAGESDEEEEEELDDEAYDDLINFSASIELDTLVWPTLKGNLDVEELDDIYIAYGTVILPQGLIELRNRLIFPDYFNVKNTLSILTPFPYMKEIKSIYKHSVEINSMYISGIEFSVLNNTKLIEVCFSGISFCDFFLIFIFFS